MHRPLLLLLLVLGLGQLPAAEGIRTGRFSTTFNETSPMSEWSVFVEHCGPMFSIPPKAKGVSYTISDEQMDVYVPKSYDGTQAYGLIVYISPTKGGAPSGGYTGVCDEHHLLWVGPADVPNPRDAPVRARLAIDAAYNMAKQYRIDPDRVYVSGMSGGGRVASHLGVPYADVFTGGAIFFCGCNSLVMPSNSALAAKLMALAKDRRYAFMTGTTDFNKPGTKQVHAQYGGLKLPQLTYIEQEGMGHTMPSAKSFAEAVTFLDAPLKSKVDSQVVTGKAAEAAKKWREAYLAYRQAAGSTINPKAAEEARAGLTRAEAALEADAAKDLARLIDHPQASALRSFVDKWPKDLPSSQKARGLADSLAQAEFAKLGGGKPSAGDLRTFLKTWGDYHVATRARDALDELAKAAWPAVEGLKPGMSRLRALSKFAEQWAPTPTATTAQETLNTEIAAQLTEIEALPTPTAKGSRLQALLGEVKGPAAAPIEAALAAVIKEVSGPTKKR